jgi:beta-alanine--pyruvate transaminase
LKVFEEGLKRGMLLRFTGDIIAMAPPVITTQDELDRMFNAVGEAIRAMA